VEEVNKIRRIANGDVVQVKKINSKTGTHIITSGGLEVTIKGSSSSSQSSGYAMASTEGLSEVSLLIKGERQLPSMLRVMRGMADGRSVACIWNEKGDGCGRIGFEA